MALEMHSLHDLQTICFDGTLGGKSQARSSFLLTRSLFQSVVLNSTSVTSFGQEYLR